MWIVKTLGRRTRNGVDHVYSVNGSFITSDMDAAIDEAFECLREQMSASNVQAILEAPVAAPAVRLQDNPDYWNGTLEQETVRQFRI